MITLTSVLFTTINQLPILYHTHIDACDMIDCLTLYNNVETVGERDVYEALYCTSTVPLCKLKLPNK